MPVSPTGQVFKEEKYTNDPNPSEQDAALQKIADINPEAAHKAMDILGYSNSPNGPITSSTLTPIPSLNYQTPQPSPIYPVGGLDSTTPPLQATEPEKQADDFITKIQGLQDRLVGQSTYRAEQEQSQGIPELQKTQTDLSARLKAIQNEAAAIPLQLQNNSEGRGITKGGLAPIESGALRNNAIQALSTSSLLEASRGNLTTALDLVDRAVAQKFDPIKEEIAVKQANLDLILKSPAYSLADKNRAQAQKDIQDKKAKAVEKQEADEALKGKYQAEAASRKADALTLRKMQAAGSASEALQISAAAGFAAPKEENKYTFQTITTEDEFGNKTQKVIALDPATGKQVGEVGDFKSPTEDKKYTFQTLTSKDEFGNETQKIVALDPSTGQQVGTVRSDGAIVSPSGEVVANNASSVAGVDTSSLGKYNPEQQSTIVAYAQQYATNGTVPTGMPKWVTFGDVSRIAKELPKDKGAVVSKITGIKDTKVPSPEQEDFGRLYNIIQLTDELLKLDKIRPDGIIGGTLGKIVGSDAQDRYLSKRKAIVDEIARMQTGAALTEDEQKFYEDYLPGRFSTPFGLGQNTGKRIENFKSLMDTKLKNTLANRQLSIYGYSTVKLGGKEYKVGDEIEVNGMKGRVNPDGTITSKQSFNSVGGDTKTASNQMNRPTRNNNPLNIKSSSATSTYDGVKGVDPIPASDGGKFLTFNSPEDGFNAAKRLIQTSGYKGLTVDAAMKRWSNSGYGGEIVPSIKGKKMSDLTPAELDLLIKTMAKREGYLA